MKDAEKFCLYLSMQQNFVPLIGTIRLTNSRNYPSAKSALYT